MDGSTSRVYLYSTPSFLKGVARLTDVFNQLDEYYQFDSGEEADYYALLSDWLSVGDDLDYALSAYREAALGSEA